MLPACGVVPFLGLCHYCGPLAFLSNDPVAVYFLYRAMFCRYWGGLNTLCSKKGRSVSRSVSKLTGWLAGVLAGWLLGLLVS